MPLLLFFAWPLAEIAGFIIVGRAIGVLPTLILTVAISALGLSLLREAGASTMARLQQGVRAPAVILAEGGIRMGAGLLLLIPGFVTDLAAVALLIFGVGRSLFGRKPQAEASVPGTGPGIGSATIEGDFRRIDG